MELILLLVTGFIFQIITLAILFWPHRRQGLKAIDNVNAKVCLFIALVIGPSVAYGLFMLCDLRPDHRGELTSPNWEMLNSGSALLTGIPIWVISILILARAIIRSNMLYRSRVCIISLCTLAAFCLWHTPWGLLTGNDMLNYIMFLSPFLPALCYIALLVHIYLVRKKLPPEEKALPAVEKHWIWILLFWLGGIATSLWYRYQFAWELFHSLPKDPPPSEGCFVVTAAAGGHRGFVGSSYNGRTGRFENAQLARMQSFEKILAHRLPRFHANLRKVYNIIGPAVAKQIRTPLRADIMYLALKPIELVAWAVLKIQRRGRKWGCRR